MKAKLQTTLTRSSKLTPRLVEFLRLLLSEDRPFTRDELKARWLKMGHAPSIGRAGDDLGNISQFITKKNPHLRQIATSDSAEKIGAPKNNYHLIARYRELVRTVLDSLHQGMD